MRVLTWICRCVPGFSIIGWLLLAYLALGDRLWPWYSARHTTNPDSTGKHTYGDLHHLTTWQALYVVYSVFVHLCGCLIFPLRLLWSMWHICDELRSARFEAAESSGYYTESECSDADTKSQSSAKGLLTPEGTMSRASTPNSFKETTDDVVHAIILPSYKEDIDTLRETLSVLGSHLLAKSSYDIYLAMEQRDPDAESTATQLILIFAQSFRNISFTLHPGDISGEVAGKSSNVSWAARQLSHNYVDNESRNQCCITVMDSDTHFSSTYFLLLSKYHRENAPGAARTLYVTPIIFDRNSNDVSPLVRTADIFWCGAGLSGLYKNSPICIPTSVYSIPMAFASHVGGWDTGPESIGEDLHMYLKCYFATAGRFNVRVLYSPASQSNVSSGGVSGWRGTLPNVKARYKQAMRHMWGALDTGYAIERALQILWSRNDQKLSRWLSRANGPEDRVPLWVNDSNLTHFTPPNVEDAHAPRDRFSKFKLIILFHRLFEAHFLPTHITIALFSGIIYSAYIPPVITHPFLLWSFGFNGTLRIIGLVLTGFYLYYYESYHQLCVRSREDEMKRAGLWEQMEGGFSYRTWRRNLIDYFLMPITGTVFGSIPGVMAEMSHFFTDKLVYTVSSKPQLKRDVDRGIALA